MANDVCRSFGIYVDTINSWANFCRKLASAINCNEKLLDEAAYDIFREDDNTDTSVTNKIIYAYATAISNNIKNMLDAVIPDNDVAVTFSVNCDDSHIFVDDREIHDDDDLTQMIHELRAEAVFEDMGGIIHSYDEQLEAVGLDPDEVISEAKESVSKDMESDNTYDTDYACELFETEIKNWIKEAAC